MSYCMLFYSLQLEEYVQSFMHQAYFCLPCFVCLIGDWGMQGNDGFTISKSLGEIEGRHEELLNEAQLAAAAEEKEAHAFEVDPAQVYPYMPPL